VHEHGWAQSINGGSLESFGFHVFVTFLKKPREGSHMHFNIRCQEDEVRFGSDAGVSARDGSCGS